MLGLELGQELDESLRALDGHGVVNAGAQSADALVALEVVVTGSLGSGDNLDPNTNITITGTYSGTDGISVTAGLGAYITLKGVSISGTTALSGCVDIANTAGNVTINLEGNNTLTGGYLRAGIYKGMGSNVLTITGSGSLTATGGVQSAGIGGNYLIGAQSGGNNVIIAGGIITAIGNDGYSWYS